MCPEITTKYRGVRIKTPPVNLTPDRNIWEDFQKNRSPEMFWREAPKKIQPRWREAPDFLRYFGVCKGKSAKSGAKRPENLGYFD